MSLSTTRPIDADMVDEIYRLNDDIYRNHWITFAYHRISERMHPYIGDNASWCTFARWSSFTVGEALDVTTPNRRLQDVLKPWWFAPVRDDLLELSRDLRRLSDSSMPRVLGLGNRYVFRDIACAMTGFLDWYEEKLDQLDPDADHAWTEAWKVHRREIKVFKDNELFQKADPALLRDGLHSYFKAMRCTATDEASLTQQAKHVLHGNVRLAVYEQWRLDPILKLALDPVAKHLIEFQSKDPTDPVPDYRPKAVLRNRGTPWAFRHRTGLRKLVADQYARSITRWWMTYDAPISKPDRATDDDDGITSIVVGKGVPIPDAESQTQEERKRTRRLGDEATVSKIVSIYDRNGDLKSEGATNWTRFSDRMQFIVELFRVHQGNALLYGTHHLAEDILRLDISKDHLNSIRSIGDDSMDDFIDDNLEEPKDKDARKLVLRLVNKGLRPDLGPGLPSRLDGTLPAWAEDGDIEAGQVFLRKYSLQIASALFNASLPKSYTAEHGTRVLTATAELASGNVNRRIAETGQMLLDLMVTDDGPALSPGTLASNAARGVRLFHGAVRHMLLADNWNVGRRGMPINQEDLLGTLVAFTVVVVDALEDMGVEMSTEEKNAYIHLWRVVGHLLGIRYDLLHRPDDPPPGKYGMDTPPDLAQLRILGQAIYRRSSGASPDGQALTASLMRMTRESLPWYS